MNVIFILCDTMVRQKLSPWHRGEGPYGHIRTPNIERLAARARRFDNHWINSAPCMPARRDLSSGRIEFPWRSWGPRESFDPDWARTLRDTAVTTALFTDHANLFDVGSGNYHHWFDHYEFVRGHYNDHCITALPATPGRPRQALQMYQQVRAAMRDEHDSFCARNLGNVAAWLDAHHADAAPFFLCVDEFDPHWPLDPPEPYRSMYLPDPSLAARAAELPTVFRSMDAAAYTPDEITWLNAQCAGKITLVDRFLGEVFDRLDRYQLWDDTLLILTTDHGEFLGEYGQMSKGGGFSYPLFARIPLLIHDPRDPAPGTASAALTCTVDLHATVLDALGVDPDPASHSRSLLPLIRGQAEQVRDHVIYGWWGSGVYYTDGRSLACKAPVQKGPLYQYGRDLGEKYVGLGSKPFDRYADAETGRFLPHTDHLVYRVPSDGRCYGHGNKDRDALFDLVTDPDCHHDLHTTDPAAWAAAQLAISAALRAIQAPAEHHTRLGLPT